MAESEPQEGYLERHGQEIAAAARRIAPYIRRTPTLETDLHPDLRLKPECFQVTGSFKARGAFNAVLALQQRHPETEGVIAVSSGNHAQALALAARHAGFRAVILIPHDANPAKVEATKALGAEVIQDGVTFANREERLNEVMAERRLTLVHPFDDWDVVHGQATAAAELLSDAPELVQIAVPCGGGGLLSGTALAAKRTRADVRVIGVEPVRADDAARTFSSGRLHTLEAAPDTVADGVRPVSIGPKTLEVMVQRGLVDDMVTVSEAEIENATRVAWFGLKLALEPTGALPLAAWLAGRLGGSGPTGLVLSGGNANPEVVARLLSSP
ncbi:MAG: threonine/serine dehydratase [Candidatus Dormibacteraeota bacterium]|nr:threonine/serine dehydratase [Candidatus Dormibacteraeota bacterium]